LLEHRAEHGALGLEPIIRGPGLLQPRFVRHRPMASPHNAAVLGRHIGELLGHHEPRGRVPQGACRPCGHRAQRPRWSSETKRAPRGAAWPRSEWDSSHRGACRHPSVRRWTAANAIDDKTTM
jgi:hypothetical protein